MIGIGMKTRFVPYCNIRDHDTDLDWRAKSITGTIVSINWEHKHFNVEYQCGSSKQQECFKFFEIGERVSVIG